MAAPPLWRQLNSLLEREAEKWDEKRGSGRPSKTSRLIDEVQLALFLLPEHPGMLPPSQHVARCFPPGPKRARALEIWKQIQASLAP